MRLRYWLTLIIITLLVGGSLALTITFTPSALSVWAEVTTATVAIIAACYATYQYLSVRKVQRQEKSSEIMRTYASELTHHIGVIHQIFDDNSLVSSIIKKIDRKEALSFTRDELSNFPITTNDTSEYYDFVFNSQVSDMKSSRGYKYIDFLPKDIAVSLPKHYSLATYMSVVLNQLECVCMEIESGAADTNYLYGSLHQTFMPFVHSAAMLIQRINTRSINAENYYPYVSRLYRRWVAQENANLKAAKRTLQEAEKSHNKSMRRL